MVRRSGSNRHGRPAATLESKRTVMVRSETCVGARVGHLRGAAIAGGAAEPGVERHRGERQADHRRDQAAAEKRDEQIAARGGGRRACVVLIGVSARHRRFIADDGGRPGLSPASRCRTGSPGRQAPRAMAIERARRARSCCSVSLMPVSGLSVRSWPRSSSCGEMAEPAPPQAPIGQQHGKQQEQIKDREAEHLLARAHAARARCRPQRQRDHRGAAGDGDDRRRAARQSRAATARRRAAPAPANRAESAAAFRLRRRPPAASARRRGHNPRCGRATAPRNAAASRRR